jgi:16S rRNA (cytosine967-C5)-methyltransferase
MKNHASSARRSARDVAREVLHRTGRGGGFVAGELDAALRTANLEPRDRALATELVYGVLRHRSRIDAALEAHTRRPLRKAPPAVLDVLRVGAYQLIFLDRVPAHAAVDDAVHAARRHGGPRIGGFVNGVLRALGRAGEPSLPDRERQPRAWIERACSLPAWLADALAAAVAPDELAAAAEAMTAAAPLYLRVNRLRVTAVELRARLLADHPDLIIGDTPLCPDALALEGLGDPERSRSFRDGWWTVQDLGAQLVSHLAGAGAEARILDACAGVGGKATHLAELRGGGAGIEAVDVSERKLARLDDTARRLGLKGLLTRVADVADDPGDGPWDAVLLDAPCTGLGVLRRHPEAKWRVGPDDVTRLAALQARMLDALAPRVAPGGVLVYAVCTFTDAEGPAQVRAFLDRHPTFERAAPPPGPVPWSQVLDADGQLRTWPHRHGADAFFAVRLRRRASGC